MVDLKNVNEATDKLNNFSSRSKNSEGVISMKKKKSNFELMKEIRGTWTLNPVTRVHDNNIKKNTKKERKQGKNLCKSYEEP